MTLNDCFDHCRTAGKRYATLQVGAECFCGDSNARYDMYGMALTDDQCDNPCGGNNEQICGGTWRNSVYDLWGKAGGKA